MNYKEIQVKYNAPLNKLDLETQTYGCRANNPNICKNAYVEGVCAFTREDSICKKPSNSWKKQYYKLLEQNSD